MLFSIPNISILSLVLLYPAVSINVKGTPSIRTFASIRSRVVPSIDVTIALSIPINLLNKEDFPTFG